MSALHFLSDPSARDPNLSERIGPRANDLLDLSANGMPFLPGFIVEAAALRERFSPTFDQVLTRGIPRLRRECRTVSSAESEPMTLRVRFLFTIPEMRRAEIRYLGLSETVRDAFDLRYGSDRFDQALQALQAAFFRLTGTSPPDDLNGQLETVLQRLLQPVAVTAEDSSLGSAVLIQLLPLGDVNGRIDSSDIDGKASAEGWPADLIDALAVAETHYLDLRQLEYITVSGNNWVVDEQPVMQPTVPARLRLLRRLRQSDRIDDERWVRAVSPGELDCCRYGTVDPASVKDLTAITGGINGAQGIAVGRVFFSSVALMTAHREGRAAGRDDALLLLTEQVQVEDLDAIDVSRGVITSQGGFTAHASIVARYLGKPSLVLPGLVYNRDRVRLDGDEIREGDFLTIDCIELDNPVLYLGRAEHRLTAPDEQGLSALLSAARRQQRGLKIMVNADTAEEARCAVAYGADGIGLCRVEHCLYQEDRLQRLRALLLVEAAEERQRLAEEIGRLLSRDFAELFSIMAGKPVSIRLLDTAGHEMLPRDEPAWERMIAAFKTLVPSLKAETARNRCRQLREVNPALGVRGSRLGILRPEIYRTQVNAVLEAALSAQQETGQPVYPTILLPFVMSAPELALLLNGAGNGDFTGIREVVDDWCRRRHLDRPPFPLKTGVMIELPAAALAAAAMAEQAAVFSFGTNDLTQTTMGLSREDIHPLLPVYLKNGLWSADPFQVLPEPVGELIAFAVRSAKVIRPDLQTVICGEHAAHPDTVRFCLSEGIDALSCAPHSLPRVILSAAHCRLNRLSGGGNPNKA